MSKLFSVKTVSLNPGFITQILYNIHHILAMVENSKTTNLTKSVFCSTARLKSVKLKLGLSLFFFFCRHDQHDETTVLSWHL